MKLIFKTLFLALLALVLFFTAINAFIFAAPLVAWLTIIPCLGIGGILAYTVFKIVKKKLDEKPE